MPKYLIEVTSEAFFRYVAECKDEEEARQRAEEDFKNSIDLFLEPTILIEQVADYVPEGDI